MWSPVLYSLIVMSIIVAVPRYPSAALAALLCMFGLEQWAQSTNPFFTEHGTLTNYIVGGIIVFALIVMFIRNQAIFSSYPKVGWLVILLFLYSFISIQWVSTPNISYDLWMKQLPYLITVILLSPLLISSTVSLSVGLKTLIPVGTMLTLLLFLNANWTYRGVEVIDTYGRKSMANPLAIAQMAGYLLLVVLHFNFTSKNQLLRLFRWVIVAGSLALAVKSGSRGQFYFMLVAGIIFFPISRRVTNLRSFVIMITGILVIIVLGERALDSISGNSIRWSFARIEVDLLGRFDAAFKVLECWYSTPLTIMFGLGNSASLDPTVLGTYPHIMALEILGEEGFIGFSLFLGIIGFSFSSIIRTYRVVRNDADKRGMLAVLGAIFCFELFLSFKQGSMIGSFYLFAFVIILGKYERIIVSEKDERLKM